MSTTQPTNTGATHPASLKMRDVLTFINDTSPATITAGTSAVGLPATRQSSNCDNCCWFSAKPQGGSGTPSSTATPENEPLVPINTNTSSAELHKAQASRTHFTSEVINNHRCKIAVTELLSPYCQAMFRSTCTTVGHVIQSVASLEKMTTYCTGAVTHDQLSASLPSSETNTALLSLSDGDYEDRALVHSNLDVELNNPLSDDHMKGSNNNGAYELSSVLIYPSEGANSLDGDLFRFTPVSLTSPYTSNLAITINIALLAARGSKFCHLSETGGVVVRDGFCSGLRCKSVSFEGTHTVVAIGNGMLRGCSAERISFSPMPRLQIVGNDWMNGCTELRKVEFACDFISLKNIGDNWLRCCRKVKSVDLECFPALETVGSGWMERCHAILTMTVNKLPMLKSVGDRWLSRCKLLSTISVTNLVTLFTVGDGCLSTCPRLRSVVFEQLPCLKSVGECWLYDCQCLASLSLIGTDNLRKVGPKWLAGTPNPLISCSNRLQGKMFQNSFEDAALRHQAEQHQQNTPPSPTHHPINTPFATKVEGGGGDAAGMTTTNTKRTVGAVGAAVVPLTQLPPLATTPTYASQ